MRRRKARARRMAVVYGVVLIALIALLVNVHNTRQAAYEYTDQGQWIVAEGDTLWNIANEYSDNRHDTRKVVHIIREINGDISPTIYPGQTIWVPLFDCMDWEYYKEVN